MMNWSDDYAVDVKEIDDQHKNLFDMVNKLKGMVARKVYHGPEIESLINFLKVYTVTHFKFEETCMKIRNCPMAEKNITSHKKLLEFVGKFEDNYKKHGGSQKNTEILADVLSKWLVQHICKIDQSLKE